MYLKRRKHKKYSDQRISETQNDFSFRLKNSFCSIIIPCSFFSIYIISIKFKTKCVNEINYKIYFINTYFRESFRARLRRLRKWVRTPVVILRLFSDSYLWERYWILSSPSYELNSTTTAFLQEWLWHFHEGWYAIKETKPISYFPRASASNE